MPSARASTRIAVTLLLGLALSVLAGCAHRGDATGEAARWQQSRQLVLVTTPDWNSNHGTLRTYERIAGEWRQVDAAAPVRIGRAGAAWGLGLHPAQPGMQKREGDGRAPAGVFAIGTAFGYADSARTALPYAAMQASHYCIDVNESPLYNRIVDANVVGTEAIKGSTEPMRRDLHADGDQRYRLGFVIEHNIEARPAGGSCIFAHLWKSPTDATAGCTAMEPAAMDRLLAWLQPSQRPVLVLLPQHEYLRLRDAWQLPQPESP